MDFSTTQLLKTLVVSFTGLSRDALHVHVGLVILIFAALVLRRPVSSYLPLLAVIAAALIGEAFDRRDDIASMGYWRWGNSMQDVVNTVFWPVVLMVLVRYGAIFDGTDLFRSFSPKRMNRTDQL